MGVFVSWDSLDRLESQGTTLGRYRNRPDEKAHRHIRVTVAVSQHLGPLSHGNEGNRKGGEERLERDEWC